MGILDVYIPVKLLHTFPKRTQLGITSGWIPQDIKQLKKQRLPIFKVVCMHLPPEARWRFPSAPLQISITYSPAPVGASLPLSKMASCAFSRFPGFNVAPQIRAAEKVNLRDEIEGERKWRSGSSRAAQPPPLCPAPGSTPRPQRRAEPRWRRSWSTNLCCV